MYTLLFWKYTSPKKIINLSSDYIQKFNIVDHIFLNLSTKLNAIINQKKYLIFVVWSNSLKGHMKDHVTG